MSLPRERTIPNKPRFGFVTEKAYEFLLEYGYSSFPISPFKVLKDLSEYVTCLPWSEAKKALGSRDPFHLREQGAEARTIRRRDDGRYLIVYDDVQVNSANRIAWTIMHEIGHIVLGHLTDFGETALNRGGLSQKKYGVLEVEAHYFAAEFLMPTALLKYFSGITVEEIALLFGVSEDAAGKKYNRVFNASYMPYSRYEDKLIRNFYDFLDTGIEDAIYKNIYGAWGIPVKSKYIPICRKCPSCHTYIMDPDAVYCSYCGSEIEQKKTYTKMFERLQKQQEFAKLPGFSHSELPYRNVSAFGIEKVQRAKYCPTCLSHVFSDDALYCNICGQPLYSYCHHCNTPISYNDCYCPVCGERAEIESYHKDAEIRLKDIQQTANSLCEEHDWIPYPYWNYIKMRIHADIAQRPEDLKAATLYSAAFIDDDDKIIVVADTTLSVAIINSHKDIILNLIKETDEIEYNGLEAYTPDDL